MKKLLNTLYVTSENSYLGLDGENVVVYDDKNEIGRLPLHNLEAIISFGYRGTSPALMGACADRNISLCYLTPQGKFLARVSGKVKGNVVLRKQQFQSSSEDIKCLEIAKNCILGKVYNSRWVLERAIRDHSMQIDVDKVQTYEELPFLPVQLFKTHALKSVDDEEVFKTMTSSGNVVVYVYIAYNSNYISARGCRVRSLCWLHAHGTSR